MNKPVNILFLCTGNACRSQMAEGWTRHLGGNVVNVSSAGIEAHGINPRAIAVMQQAGVDISSQHSTILKSSDLEQMDVVITVCDNAVAQMPTLPAHCDHLHWPLPDPAQITGDESTVKAGFDAVRDQLRAYIEGLLHTLDKPFLGYGPFDRVSALQQAKSDGGIDNASY